jgi:hypothetical protein
VTANMKDTFLVGLLMAEWGLTDHSEKLKKCVRRVLTELCTSSQLVLRRNPKLQVVVLSDAHFSVWAYFPVHHRRMVVRQFRIRLNPTTRVLLVFSETQVEQQPARKTNAELRDHLGHVLLYLRRPKAQNECKDAWREWQTSVHKNTA